MSGLVSGESLSEVPWMVLYIVILCQGWVDEWSSVWSNSSWVGLISPVSGNSLAGVAVIVLYLVILS